MKETEFYGRIGALEQKFNQVVQFIQNFTQSVRLDSTGKEIRLLALQKLLIEKGIFNEAEMTTKTGEVIQEMQKQAEEEAAKASAPSIIPATPEQTVQVTNAPATDAAVQEVVPPQV